ncbi:MAG TPA: DUF4388 domain-containing protein [Acidimicrobiales bacterium]|nr:DUF4388 domain-containing protein [Acidimicrobiales bacterium]
MALSGTLETFSLPDVLRLLASTKKTGVLALQGDRGRGRVWVASGDIVAADADRAGFADLEGTLFELLRFVDAGFEFEPGVEPVDRDEPRAVDAALDAAQLRLAEWREIEAVVPSLDVWVRMVPEVHGPTTVEPDQWRVLASVGTGLSGRGLSQYLEQGEFDVCRQLRDLVEAGMVEVDEVPAEAAAPSAVPSWTPADADEPTFVEPALSSHEVTSLGADLASFVAAGTADEPVELDEPLDPFTDTVQPTTDAFPEPADLADDEPAADDPTAEVASFDEQADEEPAVDEPTDEGEDILAQLSHLSPKAAAAIEAVAAPEADAVGDPEPLGHDAHEAAEEHTDQSGARREDIDQNLLLRFLSSSKP